VRTRPLVRLLVDHTVVESGSTFDVDVILRSRSDTPTDYVDVRLTADVGVAIPQGKSVATKQVAIMPPQTVRWSPGRLTVGEHRQRVRFSLPLGSPPSYRAAGGWCRVAYVVEVHVAIPFWIDRHAHFAIDVGATPNAPQSGSALVATHAQGPTAGQMYIEASLDATQLSAGEELHGEVSFANVKARRVRRVTIALVGHEQTRDPLRRANIVMKHVAVLVSGAPPEGESIPFTFALPKVLWPSFDARLFALRWQLEIRADVVLGTDVVLTIPLEIMRLAPGSAFSPRSRRAVPVGRQRLARVWAMVAQRIAASEQRPPEEALSFDEALGSMIASRGRVAMSIAREVHEGTLGTVATYRLPHLGLDLHLGARGLLDPIAVRKRYEPHAASVRSRFTITGRERAQLDAFFEDDELLECLGEATSVELDDDLAEVRVAGSASSAKTLETVVSSALHVLDLFAAAVLRIPPPEAMKAFEPAWRDFAAQMGGRFEPGRTWIHDATRAGFRFEVGTVWEPHGTAPAGTVVQMPIEPALPSAPSVEDASLSAVAREELRKLLATDGFHVTESAMAVFVHETVADPAKLLVHVDAFTSILRALRGGTAAGPFR
jgi:hypothetical protein